MILKRFNLKVIIRVLLIAGNVIIFARIFGDENLFFNQLILATLFIIQLVELIWFVNHTNRELSRLFYAIKHGDFSISFRDNHLGKSFAELHKSFAEILDAYKQVKIEKEIQYQFLQKLVDQINVGIISLENESIELINPTAEHLLNIHRIKNWSLVSQLNPSFVKDLDSIGDQGRRLLEVQVDGDIKIIAADVNTITILEKPHRLITLQDINSEIEQKEIEAWHKLIRILTHEIMNSVTPVTSLSETMQGMLTTKNGTQKKLGELNEETITDIRFSLSTIQKRSEGLLNFVESYRKLSRVPKPKTEPVRINDFFNHIANLLSAGLVQESVALKIEVQPDDLFITMDPGLMEQVLINLVSNSIHALQNSPDKRIVLAAYPSGTATVIEVTDNGAGIPDKELKEIFIPFFSTKKNGSGIGLSLTKQIISVHGGSIKVNSTPGYGTSFFLRFKQPQAKSV